MSIKSDLEKIETYSKLQEFIILEGIMGSQSHGTYCPQNPDSIDDVDLMSIIVLPEEYYLGLKQFGNRNTKSVFEGKYDIVFYDIKKFMSLLLNNNPNVLGLLYLPENLYRVRSEEGDLLIDNRKSFLSKKIYKSFTGYAHSQLKKMTHFTFEGYMGAKRKKLVEKHGYDCKNASHCIRLLKMGIECLLTGELNVMRHDNAMLIDIKFGKWTLEQVQKEAERLLILADEAFLKTTLPEEPDKEKAQELCIKIIKKMFIKYN